MPNYLVTNCLTSNKFESMKRSIKRKLVRAKVALNTTVEKILDINRKRKRLQLYEDHLTDNGEELNQELKLLNKIADRQAKLIRKYESTLAQEKVRAS